MRGIGLARLSRIERLSLADRCSLCTRATATAAAASAAVPLAWSVSRILWCLLREHPFLAMCRPRRGLGVTQAGRPVRSTGADYTQLKP